MANLGLAAALAGCDDTVYGDRLNHASLIDGGRLTRATIRVYAHADAADLDAELQAQTSGRALVLTDGVFSMDGDLAPLLAELDARGLRRHRRVVRQAAGEAADIELDGRPCVDFCSNDYLGLSTHPRIVEALAAAARVPRT